MLRVRASQKFFTDVEVFGRKFTLIEPVCPRCNKKIAAHFNVLN